MDTGGWGKDSAADGGGTETSSLWIYISDTTIVYRVIVDTPCYNTFYSVCRCFNRRLVSIPHEAKIQG